MIRPTLRLPAGPAGHPPQLGHPGRPALEQRLVRRHVLTGPRLAQCRARPCGALVGGHRGAPQGAGAPPPRPSVSVNGCNAVGEPQVETRSERQVETRPGRK